MQLKLKIFSLVILLACDIRAESTSLNVDNFRVIGYKYNEYILAYTGIPFAHAPIELLRFESPRPIAHFENELINDRAKENVMCAQIDISTSSPTGQEDCLYLNIYTPINAQNLPVMVYIHGGGFAWGTGTIFKPDYLLREENVILVTFNYRLGPLGFLAAGSAEGRIYGNNGLKDQALAIKWVHDHIAQFGGDVRKVTLFGNSAGAASTHLHLFSSKTKGLFNSAIIQSGGAFCPWAVRTFQHTTKLSAEFARLANCPILPTEEMIDCLKQTSLDDLLNTVTKFLMFGIDPVILFTPTVEPKHKGAFLLDFPANLIKNNIFNDVPIMQGSTPNEGGIRSGFFAANRQTIKKFDKHFNELYNLISMNMDYTTKQVKKIRKFYFGDGPLDQDDLKPLTSLWTDVYFRCTIDTPTFHHKFANSSVYSYLFNYKGALTFSKHFANNETVDLGICHMDELLYLFPMEFFFANFVNASKVFTENDEKMSLFMVKLWIHFATHKNLDDFVDLNGNSLNWKPVHSMNNEYIIIDQVSEYKMGDNLLSESLKFWNALENVNTGDKRISKDEL